MKEMRTIKFTNKKLEQLRERYEAELEETEKYIDGLEQILSKLGVSTPVEVNVIEEEIPAKRSRKSTGVSKESMVKKVKRERKHRMAIEEMAKKEGKLLKSDLKPVKGSKSVTKTNQPQDKLLNPKNTIKRKNKNKRWGVFLAPWSKPLRMKNQ